MIYASIDILEALFGGRGRVAILRLLASQTSPLTGRQVAEMTGLTQAGTSRALERLAALGVIRRRRVGRAVTQELDRENAIVNTIVLPAISAEAGLLDELKRKLAEAFAPVATSVVLFGSVATGHADAASDIDLLVVTPDATSADRANRVADEVGHTFYRRYGIPLAVIVTAESQLPKRPTGFLARARDEGVLVAGRDLREVMPHGS